MMSTASPERRRDGLPVRRSPHAAPLSVLLVALALALAAPPAAAQHFDLERITHQTTLDNGMQVIVVENHNVPLATVEVAVKTGAMVQDSSDQGVPHLFEHMLFSGYHGFDNANFGQEATALHAAYNGTTSEELVTYYLQAPSRNVEKAIGMLAQMIREPHFEPNDLNKERFVVLNEMGRDLSDPRFALHRSVSRLLWGAGWSRKNTIGEQLPLLAVTPKHLREIFDRYYVPNNAALLVTGDVDTTSVFAWARSHFGGWKRKADPYGAYPIPPMPPLDTARAVTVIGDVPDITIEVAWRGPSVTADRSDTYAADVLSQVLADDQSEFQKRLVESGMFQSASLDYETLAHVGPIEFIGTTTVDHLAAALTVLQAEVSQLGNPDYYDPDALRIAAKQRRVNQSFEVEQAAGMASVYADWWSVAGLPYYMTYGDSLSTRTPDDLARYAQRYLGGHPFVIGALTRRADAEKVSVMLQQYLDMTEDR